MQIVIEKITDAELAYVTALKEQSELGWAEITEKYNKKFKKERTLDSLKKSYQRNRDRLESPSEYVRLLRNVANTKKNNSLNSKDLRKLSEEWEKREDILDAIKGAAKDLSGLSFKEIANSKFKNKNTKKMTLELLLSDVHVGKLTDTFNHEVLKKRLKQIAETTIKEMNRAAEHYKIDRVIVAFVGDMIESATFHGTESMKGCEFGNSMQIQECLTQMFHLVFAPICIAAAKLGARVDAVGVTGNHDRTEQDRTFYKVGEDNVTWIIYRTMEEFTRMTGLKNVTWHIPVEPYQFLEIYGEGTLYEHFDNVKGSNLVSGIDTLMAKRANQLKKVIHFIRGGHYHNPMESGIGRILVNGNVPGNDGYSATHGFDCEPSQTLSFYIEREKSDSIKRLTSFYKKLLIQLD